MVERQFNQEAFRSFAANLNPNIPDPTGVRKAIASGCYPDIFKALRPLPVFVQEKLKATKSRKETDFLDAVHAIISKNLDKSDFTAENLERELCISKTQLFRRLKDLTNHSTSNYIRHFRLQKAAELLGTTVLPIGDIAERVGFRELTYFSSSFSDEFHLTPKEWRKMKQ